MDTINFEDFKKVEIRIGKIVECVKMENADKLLKLQVDFGEYKRQILSAIAEYFTPEDLIGKQFAFVVNLEPKKMGDEESQGMMFMADTAERPFLLPLSVQVPNGSVVR
jgi:methionine--tRNA ligase beta chain